jgi:hypothetical protein
VGTSLGLLAGHHLVELMGGRIWLTREAGNGRAFGFTVSANSAEESQQERMHPDHRRIGRLTGDICKMLPITCRTVQVFRGAARRFLRGSG